MDSAEKTKYVSLAANQSNHSRYPSTF